MTVITNVLAFPGRKPGAGISLGRNDSLHESGAARAEDAGRAVLRRPRLLVRAARNGVALYRRGRDLRRLMGGAEDLPVPARALPWLSEREARMDAARREGLAEWDLQTHILLLIALMAEARLAREAEAPAQAIPATAAAMTTAAMTTAPAPRRARFSVL